MNKIDFKDNNLFGHTQPPLENVPGITYLGQLKTKKSKEIKDSIVSVGFETLDRDTFDPNDIYDFLGESGIKYARVQTGWLKCEKVPGQYDWAWLDSIVNNLFNRGIRPWFCVSFGNPLYTPNPEYDKFKTEHPGAPVDSRIRGYCGETPYYFGEKAMKPWLAYVKALTEHFKNRVREYEIWNEPDQLGISWRKDGKIPYPELNTDERIRRCAADYADFAIQTDAVIKEAMPEAKTVCSPGRHIANYNYYLAENNIMDHLDVYATHIYGVQRQSQDFKRWSQTKAIMKAGELWQGESGSPASPFSAFTTCVGANEYTQAKADIRRLTSDANFGMGRSSIYTACDFKAYYANKDSVFGIINREEKRPKIAYYAIQAVATLFEGSKKADEIGIYVLPMRESVNSVLPINTIQCGAFRKNGIPLYSLFNAEREMLNADPVNVYVCIQQGPEKIDDLVAIDPIRQAVYSIKRNKSVNRDCAATVEISNFPVPDYPIFITDRKAIEIE